MNLSLIIPIHNERENIPRLHAQISQALLPLGTSYEIVFVDDGSYDGSREELASLSQRDPCVKVVRLRRNFGQTAAMQAGLDYASGEILITLDGDLQNDPADIPLLLETLEQGCDLVHGWRKCRQDAWLHRKLPSRVANWLISRTTGFPIHDLGCTLKAVRAEIARELELYGEMHRFIPILAYRRGARCREVVVRHHPRRFGKTKYGISRTTRVILDLATVKFLLSFFDSPMKLFGRFALASLLAGMASGAATIAMKLSGGIDMTGNPLLMLTVFCFLSGLQLASLGLLGELCTRLYYAQAGRRPYTVADLTNFRESEPQILRRAA